MKKAALTSSLLSTLCLVLGLGLGVAFGPSLSDGSGAGVAPEQGSDEAGAEIARLRSSLSKAEARIELLDERLRTQPTELSAAPVSSPKPSSIAAAPALSKKSGESLALQARVTELEELLAKAKRGELELSDEDVKERVDSAQASFDKAFASKNGAAAIKAMGILAKLDERAFPALVALWDRMEKGKWLGLGWRRRNGWASASVFHWALSSSSLGAGDVTGKAFRRQAVWLLPWYEQDRAKRSATFAGFLSSLPDPKEREPGQRRRRGRWEAPQDLFRGALGQLARVAGPASSEALSRVARRFDLPSDVRATAVRGLARQTDRASMAILETARRDPAPEVRGAAELGLAKRDPAVDGWLITSVTPGSQAAKAGIEVGSIVVSYDGKPVRNDGDLNRLKRGARNRKVAIQAHKGALRSFTIQGGQTIGIDGEAVVKRD